MQRNKLTAFALLILSLSFITSCAVNPVTGKQELMFVSEAEEVKMGREFYPNALWGGEFGGGEYRDPKLKAYLKGLVMDIHRVSHRPGLPVSFAIQNSSVPNAWAIPGYVVITRGLLSALKSEAEFVFVMGHEMGHVAARHSASALSKRKASSAGLTIVGLVLAASGNAYADAAVKAGELGTGLVLLKYSRSDELEADRLGVEYMTSLGYDPSNALKAHKNLERAANEYMKSTGKGSGESNFLTELLSTHPRTSIRLMEISRLKPAQGKLRGDGTGQRKFSRMTAGLIKTDRAYKDYYDEAYRASKKDNSREALEIIKAGLSKQPGEAPFHTLKGFILVDRGRYGPASQVFKDALSIDEAYQPAIRGNGVTHYYRKNYTSSRVALKKALKIYPADAPAHLYLGLTLYKLNKPREALRYLKPYAAAVPKNPLVHYYLGASYEDAGDKKSAYKEYLRQIQVAPDTREGRLAKGRTNALK